MNSDEINLDEEFPPDIEVAPQKVEVRVEVPQVIVPNMYPSKVARYVEGKHFGDNGTVSRVVREMMRILEDSNLPGQKRLGGLSATQIGEDWQIMVIGVAAGSKHHSCYRFRNPVLSKFNYITLVNPTITKYSLQGVICPVSCYDTKCGNDELVPICLTVLARDVNGRTIKPTRNLVMEGKPEQDRLHEYTGMDALRVYHHWRHLGHQALDLKKVSERGASMEISRLT